MVEVVGLCVRFDIEIICFGVVSNKVNWLVYRFIDIMCCGMLGWVCVGRLSLFVM